MPEIEIATTQKSIAELIDERNTFLYWFRSDLKDQSLADLLIYWSDHVHPDDIKYRTVFRLLESNIIPKTFADGKLFTVDAFRHIKHLAVIDYIKGKDDWSELAKDELIKYYNEFLEWLNKISFNMFEADLPSFQMSLRAIEQTLTYPDWRYFIETLEQINKRDALIALLLLQGQKRVSQVITLTIDQVDFENCTVRYQSKNKSESVKYEASCMKELQEYVRSTTQLRKKNRTVFLTRTGKPITRLRLNYSFNKACTEAAIKQISPDSLRGIYPMLIQQKWTEQDIMQSKKARIQSNKKKEELRSKEEKARKEIYKNLELKFKAVVPND